MAEKRDPPAVDAFVFGEIAESAAEFLKDWLPPACAWILAWKTFRAPGNALNSHALQTEFVVMPNDAKLGLVVGVGIVIAVAVVFFRKEAGAALPVSADGPAVSVGSGKESAGDRSSGRPVNAKRTVQGEGRISQAIPAVRRHTVMEGDTLTGLAEQYYGDGGKSDVILQANRDVLQSADDLTPGTRIVIPTVPKKATSSQENKDPAAIGN